MPEDITTTQYLLQLAPIAVVFIFFIKEFFISIKNKNNNGNERELGMINQRFTGVEKMLGNHVEHLCKDIGENKEDIKEIKTDIESIKIQLIRIEALVKK
jgi:hypothetical protein